MEMILHLKDEIFDLVKYGSKNIEIRLYDEKRKKLNVGDTLIFYKNEDESKKVIAEVEELNIFDNIEELVNNYDLRNMYFENSSKEELISIFNEIYSKDKQEEYKVVAIKFEKKEKSCGIVVFNDKQEVLLVHHFNGHWGYPKGHVEENETEEETAIREVLEETNIRARIMPGFRKIVTYSPSENTMKDVILFVGEAINTDAKPQEIEVSECKFVSVEEAFKLLNQEKYFEYVNVLEEAVKFYCE